MNINRISNPNISVTAGNIRLFLPALTGEGACWKYFLTFCLLLNWLLLSFFRTYVYNLLNLIFSVGLQPGTPYPPPGLKRLYPNTYNLWQYTLGQSSFYMQWNKSYHLLIHLFHPPSPPPPFFQCWRFATRDEGRYAFQIVGNYRIIFAKMVYTSGA